MSADETAAAVIGGGTMGSGIAHALLATGRTVTLVEADTTRGEIARQSVAQSLHRAEARDKLPAGLTASGVLERLAVARSIGDLAADNSLVVEAVPERLELKREVLGEAARVCRPDALLASNTSSLSIGRIAEGLPAERVLGMHFFNPVPAQKLVELVRHPGNSDEVLDRAGAVVAEMGKTAIVVNDSPGFATSRLGVAVGLEAIRMLEEGVATAEDIDTGMELGYRWPVGPLKLTDMVGLDVRLAIAEHLAGELGPRFEPPELLRAKVEKGELGKKTGHGFYDWPT